VTTKQDIRAHLKDAKRWCGYRKAVWVDECDTMVVLVDSYEQGIGDGKWAIVCDKHSSILVFENQAEAKNFMPEVEHWCEECQNTTKKETPQ
jgi:hypothetical protein